MPNLARQLPGGGQDKCTRKGSSITAREPLGRELPAVSHYTADDWETKCSGLPRPCLGTGHQIAPSHQYGYSVSLDRSRLHESAALNVLVQGLLQIDPRKGCSGRGHIKPAHLDGYVIVGVEVDPLATAARSVIVRYPQADELVGDFKGVPLPASLTTAGPVARSSTIRFSVTGAAAVGRDAGGGLDEGGGTMRRNVESTRRKGVPKLIIRVPEKPRDVGAAGCRCCRIRDGRLRRGVSQRHCHHRQLIKEPTD